MRPVVRRAIPFLMSALAVAHAGCGSKSSEQTPTGLPAPGGLGDDEGGRVRSMAATVSRYGGELRGPGRVDDHLHRCGTTIAGLIGVSPLITLPHGLPGSVRRCTAHTA